MVGSFLKSLLQIGLAWFGVLSVNAGKSCSLPAYSRVTEFSGNNALSATSTVLDYKNSYEIPVPMIPQVVQALRRFLRELYIGQVQY